MDSIKNWKEFKELSLLGQHNEMLLGDLKGFTFNYFRISSKKKFENPFILILMILIGTKIHAITYFLLTKKQLPKKTPLN